MGEWKNLSSAYKNEGRINRGAGQCHCVEGPMSKGQKTVLYKSDDPMGQKGHVRGVMSSHLVESRVRPVRRGSDVRLVPDPNPKTRVVSPNIAAVSHRPVITNPWSGYGSGQACRASGHDNTKKQARCGLCNHSIIGHSTISPFSTAVILAYCLTKWPPQAVPFDLILCHLTSR